MPVTAMMQSLESNVLFGFQVATSAGPLCDEPMWGLALSLRLSYLQLTGSQLRITFHEQYGIFTGQVMTAVREAYRPAVRQMKPRIMEALCFWKLNTPTEYLGCMYAVLARRRARVIKEEMQEGSPLFTVHAYVPVAESFGFADELRRWTSGAASALLVLSHWETLLEDLFFMPKTEEELEDYGDGSSVSQNMARKLIDGCKEAEGSLSRGKSGPTCNQAEDLGSKSVGSCDTVSDYSFSINCKALHTTLSLRLRLQFWNGNYKLLYITNSLCCVPRQSC